MNVAIVDGIEIKDGTPALHKAASQENRLARKKSVVSPEAARKAEIENAVMETHLVVIVVMNVMINKRNVAETKTKVAAGLKKLLAN